MGDNINRIVVAVVSIFILFIFPVYISYEKKDDIAYALALRHTQDFVDRVRSKGYITKELYEEYLQNLYATGNLYDIELTHSYIRFDKDETTSATADPSTVTAKRNVEVFTTDYIKNILEKANIYTMNEGDNFNVVIKNSNVTLATVLYNMVTMNMSKNNIRIYVDYGGSILADKWYSQNIEYIEHDGIYMAHTEGIINVAQTPTHILNVFGTKYGIDKNTTWQDIVDSDVPVTVEVVEIVYGGMFGTTRLKINSQTLGWYEIGMVVYDVGSTGVGSFSVSFNNRGFFGMGQPVSTKIMSMNGKDPAKAFALVDGWKTSGTVCSDIRGNNITMKSEFSIEEFAKCVGKQNIIYITEI